MSPGNYFEVISSVTGWSEIVVMTVFLLTRVIWFALFSFISFGILATILRKINSGVISCILLGLISGIIIFKIDIILFTSILNSVYKTTLINIDEIMDIILSGILSGITVGVVIGTENKFF